MSALATHPDPPPVGYPAELESAVLLVDGRVAQLRPIVPSDARALVDFARHLSAQSVYFRFFTPKKALTAEEVRRFVTVDYTDRLALVAIVDGLLVAVARYDRPDRAGDEAEVAFTVRDDHQGRGLGMVLLEHLASAAVARGITRFVGDTLAENERMLTVFRRAGFEEHASFESGVVRVRMELSADPGYVEKLEERDRRATVTSIERLLRPASVAVVGASGRRRTVGGELVRNLVAGAFTGPVHLVNPAGGVIEGLAVHPDVASLPEGVDLAVVAVPAAAVQRVVEELGERGVGGLVVISAGFAETGPAGAAAERELVEVARRSGMRLVGPNCMGVVNTAPDVRLNATFSPVEPLAGRVAFSSQSGGLGIAILNEATRRDLGVSSFVSVGNKADVSGNDLLCYWEADPDTSVILLHLESFGNPRRFSTIARRVARRKPIVAVKSGRSLGGGLGGASSSGESEPSLDAAAGALFRQAGVIRVDTLEELFDVADVLTHQPLPAGRRVGIVCNAGGPAVLAADACEAYGLSVPELSESSQSQLREALTAGAGVANPVEAVASATAADYRRALEIVLSDPGIDTAIVIFTPPLVTEPDAIADAVASVAAGSSKPILANFLATSGTLAALRAGERKVPWFAYPESAARALGRIAPYAEWRATPEPVPPVFTDVDPAAGLAVVEHALARVEPGVADVWLDPDDTAALLAAYSIPFADRRDAPAGVEVVIGVVEDPSFGPLVTFGVGGAASELLGDRALSLVPISRPEAVELVGSLRSSRLLTGYGGAPAADVGSIADLLCRVGRMAEDLPHIAQMDLDPVVASPDGCVVLGAKVRVCSPASVEPVLRRRHLR